MVMRTKNCIFCGRKATYYCGCVDKGGKAIIAGTCRACHDKKFAPGHLPMKPVLVLESGETAVPVDEWREEYGLETC